MMGRYDCIVLYNATKLSEIEGCEERLYPSNIIREEVSAIEEILRDADFSPYVLSVEQFSRDMVQTILKIAPKFIFNLCEEINGKCELEMCVAGLLEMMAVPYTGSGPFALGLALNKFHVKQILRSAGVPVPRGYLVRWQQKVHARSSRFPVIVKPVHEDGSLGINSSSVCPDLPALEKQVAYIHEIYQQDALVEEFLSGREFNVSLVGDGEPEVLAISEIDFSGMPAGDPKIVSYRAKWDEESPMYTGTVPICPAVLSKRLEERIKTVACRSYRSVGCRDYARVDMRTDAAGNPYVLEVNPNPDISPKAGFARAAQAAGYSYSDIILRICQAAQERGARVIAPVYAF
jgi:D-alanine-D-alanine ligase